MKDLVGRKVKGFKFENRRELSFTKPMEKNIGEIGIIVSYDIKYDCFIVRFKNKDWGYPASEIEQHLVNEVQKGEMALFSDDNKVWEESIFLESHDDNRVHPFTAVKPTSLWKYKDGKSFWTEDYAYMKRIEAPTYTIEQLKEKVGNFKLKL